MAVAVGTPSLQADGSNSEPVRPLVNFPPSLWGDRFNSINIDISEIEAYEPMINVLKEKVREMLIDPTSSVSAKMELIDHVNRLGLSYHFNNEIDKQLEILFTNLNFEDVKEYDLFTVSLQFRVFRQFGYKMPCDVFEKFLAKTGKFMESLASDVRGMLSLYEASYLRIRGEEILDEALVFSKAHLQNVQVQSPNLSPLRLKQITRALDDEPLIRRLPRIETGFYIPIYEEDEERIEVLLKLAKLDFNKLQLLHLHELRIVANWYKDLKFTAKVPHSRDRIVESYFWILATRFEPQYSVGRIVNAKLVASLVTIDDSYDAYGTLEEVQLFTDATDRWNESAMDMLPVDNVDSWKFTYKIMLDVCTELDELINGEGTNIEAYSAKAAMQEIVREYNQEHIWSATKATPTFEEYMKNSLCTCGLYLMALGVIKGMGDIATKDVFDWLLSPSNLRNATEITIRFSDDIVTHETEQARGQLCSAVYYYMIEHNVSRTEAIKAVREMIENGWKDMNEECFKPIDVPREIIEVVFNLARAAAVLYTKDDGFTRAEILKEYVELLLLKPMVI